VAKRSSRQLQRPFGVRDVFKKAIRFISFRVFGFGHFAIFIVEVMGFGFRYGFLLSSLCFGFLLHRIRQQWSAVVDGSLLSELISKEFFCSKFA
jgi:hypothetical protein